MKTAVLTISILALTGCQTMAQKSADVDKAIKLSSQAKCAEVYQETASMDYRKCVMDSIDNMSYRYNVLREAQLQRSQAAGRAMIWGGQRVLAPSVQSGHHSYQFGTNLPINCTTVGTQTNCF